MCLMRKPFGGSETFIISRFRLSQDTEKLQLTSTSGIKGELIMFVLKEKTSDGFEKKDETVRLEVVLLKWSKSY